MTVQEDFVWGEGYGNGSKADDERCKMYQGVQTTYHHIASFIICLASVSIDLTPDKIFLYRHAVTISKIKSASDPSRDTVCTGIIWFVPSGFKWLLYGSKGLNLGWEI